jgi:hypothetical protein
MRSLSGLRLLQSTRVFRLVAWWLIAGSLAGLLAKESSASPQPVAVLSGICDASAAVALGPDDAFVVADDEDEVLDSKNNDKIGSLPFRVYRLSLPGRPVLTGSLPGKALDPTLGTKGELDLEGSARIGDLIYWIGSHSAGKEAKEAPNRRRLFAVQLKLQSDRLEVVPVGKPYKTLLEDLFKDPRYDQFNLEAASRKESKKVPNEKDPNEKGKNNLSGLSIEGLAANSEGELLIGFRNPVRDGKALVVTLKNPKEVMAGKPARFSAPVQLALNGMGIRSMELIQGQIYIVAGPPGDPKLNAAGTGPLKPHVLYRWSGRGSDQPVPMTNADLGGSFPEALFAMNSRIYHLSDDGKVLMNGQACGELKRTEDRQFRAFSLPLPLR